jgi:hypothetical protein
MTIRAALAGTASVLVSACPAVSLLLAAPPAHALKRPIFPPDNPWNQRAYVHLGLH